MTPNTINEIRYQLSNDYLIPVEYHENLLIECCLDYGLTYDPTDLELWEVLLSNIRNIYAKPNLNIVDNVPLVEASKAFFDKRDVKKEDIKPIESRFIGIKGKTTLKTVKPTIKNSSIAPISNKSVITDIGEGFLYNIDRSHALHFVKNVGYLIRKKNKTTQPLKLGYFETIHPTYLFQSTINYTHLTLGEMEKLISFFHNIKMIVDSGKLTDLRYYLQMTFPEDGRYVNPEKTLDQNLNRYQAYKAWIDNISFNALEHWLKKVRKKDINTSGYYIIDNGTKVLNHDRLYDIWVSYHYN